MLTYSVEKKFILIFFSLHSMRDGVYIFPNYSDREEHYVIVESLFNSAHLLTHHQERISSALNF